MKLFKFIYQGQLVKGLLDRSADKQNNQYKIRTGDQMFAITFEPSINPEDKKVWLQITRNGDTPQRREMIQAVGEGLEQSGLVH